MIKETIKKGVCTFAFKIIDKLNKSNFELQKFGRVNERSTEYAFTLSTLSKLSPSSVLDVGTGKSPFPALLSTCGYVTTAIDQKNDYWQGSMTNQHFHVLDDDIIKPKIGEKFDCVTCISVLEHIPDQRKAVKNMLALLNPGGHLIITAPYCENEYFKNIYEHPESSYGKDSPYIAQVFSKNEVSQWLEDSNADLVEQNYYQAFTGKHWTFGERLNPVKSVDKDQPHQLSAIVLKARD